MTVYSQYENYSTPAKVTRATSPFLDIASTTTPKTIKSLFYLVEHYALQMSQITAALRKKAAYPVTSIVYDITDSDSLVKKWKEVLETILGFPEKLQNINENFFCYGNVFVSVRHPIKKTAKCGACNFSTEFEKIQYDFSNGKVVMAKCPKCGSINPPTEITDTAFTDKRKFRLMVWDPNRIGIKYNSMTGDTTYTYQIPEQERNDIAQKKYSSKELSKIEQIYIETALDQTGKVVVFADDTLYHMKAPSLAGVDPAWGYPTLLSIIKDLYYTQILKKANEAVMFGHMVPFRYLFPVSPPDSQVPFGGLNLSSWKNFAIQEISRWTKDPNYIAIFPYQIGQGAFGGNGRSLLAQNELNELSRHNLAGLGVPQEFLYGGLSYSGSNVSLRMLENEFLTIRKENHKLLDFIIKRVAVLLDLEPIPIHFSNWKMADDMQKKQLYFQLQQAGVISVDTLLDELELDSKEEAEKMRAEVRMLEPLKTEQNVASARIQGKAMEVQQKEQYRISKVMQETQQKDQMFNAPPPQETVYPQGGTRSSSEQREAPEQEQAVQKNQQAAKVEQKDNPEAKPPRSPTPQI